MDLNRPLVSVLMTVYNSEKYLEESIDSILNQTFKDFEFLIIDDGSTDKSAEIINSYRDPRIILHQLKDNSGPSKASNIGLNMAKGKYVARMDADDISKEDRLEKQVSYLGEHKDIILLGGGMEIISEDGSFLGMQPVLEGNMAIKLTLFVTCPFVHPSTMYNKRIALNLGGYNEKLNSSIDYDLWVRLMNSGSFANINEPLIKYRQTLSGISISKREQQKVNSENITNELWKNNEDPVPRDKWNLLWYKKAETRAEKEYFIFLHIEFFRRYLTKRKYLIALTHVGGAMGISFAITTKIIFSFIFAQLSFKE